MVVNAERRDNYGDYFTVDDIKHNKVSYLHNGGDGEIDSIGFVVDGQPNQGYLGNGTFKKTFFHTSWQF